jgi:hypothetical protein
MTPPLPTLLYASARASVHFTLTCLEPIHNHLRAKSSFVNPQGEIMHWHEFGDLEGPGWAANSLGGAALLYRWGSYTQDQSLQAKALALVDHVLEDGFVDTQTGFVWPYYELAQQRFCLNYAHNDDWLCPGSLARIGTHLLEFADLIPNTPRAAALHSAAVRLAQWVQSHTPRLSNGWVPRRITLEGNAYAQSPTGGPDAIFDHSADGLFLLELLAGLTTRKLADYRQEAIALGDTFVAAGGLWGSINHDTYDDHESVAYSVAYRILTRAGEALDRPAWKTFAAQTALPALERFRMREDRQGVATRGLLWMEDTWDTAYLWESAEAAQAYLESWSENKREDHLAVGLEILRAIAEHHTGPLGFLTEGVDWNNHVTRRHHVGEALYGDIQYTEPLLNHLHFVGPTLFYFEQTGVQPVTEIDDAVTLRDADALRLVQELSASRRPPVQGADGARYMLRFYYPALETDERLAQALDFTKRSGADAALLFEASYDMDPALLTMDTLRARFARLTAIVPRFRELVPEVHINMMITLGHVDSGCGQPEHFDFQFMVDEHGNLSRSTACPLDPAFLARTAEQYRLAAETGADAVWVDDDTRLVIHDLPGMTCFCPRHVAAFAAKTGRPWTRESLVAALVAESTGAGAEHPSGGHELRDANSLRAAWFDLQEETVLGLARVIEQAVHEVNVAMRIGLMTVGTAFHAAEGRRTDRLLRALSGSSTRPLIRPGSGYWNDWQPAALIDKTEDGARQLAFLGADVQALSEVENHPYTPYTKTNRVLAQELALDVLAGMTDLSLNILTSMGGSAPLEPEGTDYAPFLVAQRPFLNALAREWAGRVRRGVGIACKEDTPRYARLTGHDLHGWFEPRPWEPLLARLGYPIGRPDQGPHWVAGPVAWSLSEGEWRQYLREGAVLDPVAAQALLAKGLGALIGLSGLRPMKTAVNEQFSAEALNGHRAGTILPAYNHIPPAQLYTWDVANGSTANGSTASGCTANGCILSRWLDVDGHDQGSALVLAEGANHERAVLLPYEVRTPAAVLLNVAHREQWAAALQWAARADLPVRVTAGSNLYPQAFYRPADGSWLLAIANLAADDALGEVQLSFAPGKVERLTPDGVWKEEEMKVEVAAFGVGVWRITK